MHRVSTAYPGFITVGHGDSHQWCVSFLELTDTAYFGLMRHDSPTPDTFILSKVRLLKNGSDICILSYGPIMKMAIGFAKELEAKGPSVAVASVHTLKPLDVDGISALLSRFNMVVVEEHSIRGGLGSQVKELAWDPRLDCIIHVFGLRDEFMHIFGSQTDLWHANGLSVENITRKILVD